MRASLVVGLVAGFASAFITAGAAHAQAVTWKVAIFGPPRAVTVPIEHVAREVAAKTGGQLKIEPVYGEALSKATEIIDGLKAGAFEVGLLCASYYPGKLPLYTVLDLAMLTPDDVMAQARVQMAVAEHPAVAQEFKRWNLRMLLPGPLPQYQMMGKRRITRVEDLKGVRVRVSGEMARVLEDYGAVKSLVPAPETYTSLERGIVDMITFPATYAFTSYRLQEISKYFIDRISLGSQPCFWGVSETAWSTLAPAHRKLLLDLREPAIQAAIQAYQAADEKNYADWKARGIEIINFPPAERAKLAANAGKHWQEWAQDKDRRGLPGKALLEFVQAKIKDHAK
jgi:TRAP-type C4-dicarboxylate transport system substrate-binding protein